MKGSILENHLAALFQEAGYLTFVRKNHCDIVALKLDSDLCYLVECKSYPLSRKQQILAVRELNRNHKHALDLLSKYHFLGEDIKLVKVLVAPSFKYQAKNIYQFTIQDLVKHIQRK